ncbi:alpha/beta hydrolase fold family protein 5 [Umbelopsis sp. AD052]|nr:alpha/beta hydrolase fold family protein 5 [Umbelopsis sp. AD052]
MPASISNKYTQVDGVNVFYREAGSRNNATILLLHGYPSSSHQYRNLIPILADQYHVLAPDIPGFGFTEVPSERQYQYTFESFAKTIGDFVTALNVKSFAVYIFDYGAPTGLRLALNRPDLKITAIISQNGNAYEEGLGDFWVPIQRLWKDNSKQNREALLPALTLEGTKSQYVNGVPKNLLERIQPESYHLDQAGLERPGNKEIQLDIFYDYRTNLGLYPQFQAYIKDNNIPVLAVWGKNDNIFIPPGAEAFKRANPSNTVVKLLDAGHFALETHVEEIGTDIISFLKSYVA